MRTTKRFPCKVSLVFPNGKKIEITATGYEAFLVKAQLELDEYLKKYEKKP